MAKKNKPLTANGIVSTWTGVAIWLVIMTWFGWWYAWWAYFPLIGVISGAIQQTISYRQMKTAPVEPNYIMPDPNAPIQSGGEVAGTFCPGCGGKLTQNTKNCPTCGFVLN